MAGKPTNNIVCISDIHSGCKTALCPPEGVDLDDGGVYMPSKFQRKMWAMWEEFWLEWVPQATKGEPYCVVFNGDAVEGVHHGATTQITSNLMTQSRIAYRILSRVVDLCDGNFYMVRGTEAHVGPSAAIEEALAKSLKAIPNDEGQYARYDLWKRVGPKLCHFLHHIGSTGSQAYEATAVHKELVEEFAEAGRWRNDPPDVVARSHRHRYMETCLPIGHVGPKGKQSTGKAISVVTPCWQGKTPFAWKIPGARLSTPQFGGIVIRYSDEELFVRPKVWTVDRTRTE